MKQPAKWLNTIAPWVKHMINVFRFGAHLAGPVMGYAAEGLNELIKNDIKLMKAIVDEFPEIEKHEELIAKHGFKESESASIMGDGASLRSLRKFLLTLDPEEEWGDLRKTLTPEGHWLWLCDEHAEVYRR